MFGTERRAATGRGGAAGVLTPPPSTVRDAKVAPTPGGFGAAFVMTSVASTVADTICFSGGRLVALGVLTSPPSAVRGAQQPLQRSFGTPGVFAQRAFVRVARPVRAAHLGTILLTFETPGVGADFATPVADT